MQNPISEIILRSPIGKHEADRGLHAIRAKDARERAVIFLRLLAGESEWSDGYERRVDDCFEMNYGNDVVMWLLRFAAAEPFIERLLSSHRTVGQRVLTEWREKYKGSPSGELALA